MEPFRPYLRLTELAAGGASTFSLRHFDCELGWNCADNSLRSQQPSGVVFEGVTAASSRLWKWLGAPKREAK